jgi:peptide/nickel transport system substrate-binding protein
MQDPRALARNALVPTGDLAEKWEQPDQTTAVFHLRSGIRFFNLVPVNGRALTSGDVAYSWQRQRDLQVNATYLDPVDRCETPDASTFRVLLSRPDSDLFVNIGDIHNRVIAHEVVEARGDLKEGTPIGSGAWMVKDFVPGTQWVWQRNPDYYIKDHPYLDSYTSLYFNDRTQALAALRLGKIDSSGPSAIFILSKLEADQLKKDAPRLTIVQNRGWQGFTLYAHTQKAPTSDPRVRQALSKAIDRLEIISVAQDGAGWLSTTLKLPSEDALLDEAEFKTLLGRDVQGAKQLLAAAGVTSWSPTLIGGSGANAAAGAGAADSVADLLQSMLKDIGINVTRRPVDAATAAEVVRGRGDFEITLATSSLVGMSTSQDLYARFRSGGSLNAPRTSDPQLDQLIEQQAVILDDPAGRNDVLKQIQRRIIELAGTIPIASSYRIGAAQPRLQDWGPAIGPDYSDDSCFQFAWLAG